MYFPSMNRFLTGLKIVAAIRAAFACAVVVKILHEMDFDALFTSAMSLSCQTRTSEDLTNLFFAMRRVASQRRQVNTSRVYQQRRQSFNFDI